VPLDPEALANVVLQTIEIALGPVQAVLTELRDRLVTLETKAAQPLDLADLRERIATCQTRTDTGIAELRTGLSALAQTLDKDAARLEGYTAALQRDAAGLGERVAAMEVLRPLPGPAGKDGRDGLDGLGFDDLSVDFDGDRSLVLTYARGDQKKTVPVPIPFLKYQGVYTEGRVYQPGDVVTYAGSAWHCKQATGAKPEVVPPGGAAGKDCWTLIVKQGREGKPGRDGRDLYPMPAVAAKG
jgi:hypothetical protein